MKSDSNEAVFFFGKKGITKEMLYAEFEAVLDGVVGIPEFAGQEVQACYLTISSSLEATGCVLFAIEFDEAGRADRDWNIPLRHLVENAGPGPDMGSGPIRLACRSQCSVAWYQRELWEPSTKGGLNHFVAIRDALKRNRLGLKKARSVESSQNYSDIPVINDQVPPLLTPDPAMVAEQAKASAEQAKASASDKALIAELKAKETLYRSQIVDIATEYKEKFQQLDERRKQDIEQLKRVMRNESQVAKQQLIDSEQLIAQKSVLYETLAEKYRKLAAEFEALREKFGSQKEKLDQLKDAHLELLEKQASTSKTGSEELGRLHAQVSKLTDELDTYREAKIEYEKRLIEAKNKAERAASQKIDEFIDQLQSQDVVFVAYHAGAGHMSLPAKLLKDYLEDPDVYAAQKCGVSVNQYREWVAHYEASICQECGVPIKRIDSPAEYVEGNHNYCVRHKKNSNVSPLRRSS
ncbi:hypothetical protein [Gynuella sp.]|uniref:hypothetical protein n=1 Tax=Gynuella sp. TaxID=2969146 RepID=UPI003D13101C